MVITQATTLSLSQPNLDDFICIDNATLAAATPLENNPVALEILRGWCGADTRCSELYDQDGAPDLATFTFLFQTTLTRPLNSVFLETPLFDNLCNMTVLVYQQRIWVLMLINQILEANVCAVNERFVLTPGLGSGGTCVCQPGKTCDSQTGDFIVQIIILVVVILAVVIQFGVVFWNRTRIAESRPMTTVPVSSRTKPISGHVSFRGSRQRKRTDRVFDL